MYALACDDPKSERDERDRYFGLALAQFENVTDDENESPQMRSMAAESAFEVLSHRLIEPGLSVDKAIDEAEENLRKFQPHLDECEPCYPSSGDFFFHLAFKYRLLGGNKEKEQLLLRRAIDRFETSTETARSHNYFQAHFLLGGILASEGDQSATHHLTTALSLLDNMPEGLAGEQAGAMRQLIKRTLEGLERSAKLPQQEGRVQ